MSATETTSRPTPNSTPSASPHAHGQPRVEPRNRLRRRGSLVDGPWRVAFLLTLLSFVLWRRVVVSPSTVSVGSGGRDFHFYIWSLEVIARGVFRWGPGLRTSVIYPFEGGVPLTADTTILGFGFLLAPITRLFGAVVTLNLVMLSALPLNGAAAFWAYRKVLRCGLFGSLLGALVFATSPYVMAHSLGHANLVHLWWLPLAAGLIVPAVAGGATASGLRLRSRPMVRAALGGVVLGFAMFLGSELVAIAAIVTAPWFVVLYLRRRPKLRIGVLAVAALCAVIVSAPVVWGTIGDANRYSGIHQPSNVFVTDMSNLIVPTAESLVGSAVNPSELSSRWTGNGTETTGYISLFGVSLIVIALQRRTRAASRPFAALCAWGLVLSLGPFLHIGGVVTEIPLLPGMVLTVLPLLGSVLPGRISFVIFAALGATIASSFGRSGEDGTVAAEPADDDGARFRAVRERVCKVLALATVVSVLPPLTMSSVPVAAAYGASALERSACGSTGDVSRAVAVPRSESSYDALSWQARGNFDVQLVRARYFALDYPLHGNELLLDRFVVVSQESGSRDGRTPSSPPPGKVVEELRSLGTNCVVAAPSLVDTVLRSNLDGLFGESRRSDGLDYWTVG